MKKYVSIILNFLLVICGFIGIYLSCHNTDGFMNQEAFLYYTVQSNIFVMFTSFIAGIFETRKLTNKEIPNFVYSLRFIATVDITLTFVVFSLMLTPVLLMQGYLSYILSLGNLFVHNVIPLLAIFDWCFFGKSKNFTIKQSLLSLVFPFVYCLVMLIRAFFGIKIEGNLVPYFFLDYEKSGWLSISKNGLGVIYWIIILTIALIGMCIFFKRIVNRKIK